MQPARPFTQPSSEFVFETLVLWGPRFDSQLRNFLENHIHLSSIVKKCSCNLRIWRKKWKLLYSLFFHNGIYKKYWAVTLKLSLYFYNWSVNHFFNMVNKLNRLLKQFKITIPSRYTLLIFQLSFPTNFILESLKIIISDNDFKTTKKLFFLTYTKTVFYMYWQMKNTLLVMNKIFWIIFIGKCHNMKMVIETCV